MKSYKLNFTLLVSTFLLWIIIDQSLFSQELKHQKKSLGSRMSEEFDVVKDDKEIKQGTYQLKIENLICQIGTYRNNQRSGIWKIYTAKDELELEYDYDKDELVYVNKKYYTINGDSTLLLPIYLGGSKYIIQSVFKDIDPRQFQWGSGRLIVSFEVDSNGIPHRFMLNESCNYPNLDKLAINAVKSVTTSNFKFLPARQDGKAIPYVILLPLYYSARVIKMGHYK